MSRTRTDRLTIGFIALSALILALLTLPVLLGCARRQQSHSVEREMGAIGTLAGNIGKDALLIKDDTAAILVVPELPPEVPPKLVRIEDSANRIGIGSVAIRDELALANAAISAERDSADKAAGQAADEIAKLKAEIVSLKAAIEKIKEDGERWMRRTLYALMLAGTLAVAIGMALLYLDKRNVKVIVFGVCVFGAAAAALVAIKHIEWVAGVSGFIIAAILIWKAVESRKERNQQHDAAVELVTLNEGIKEVLSPTQRETVFGDDGMAANGQSPKTKEIVAVARDALKAETQLAAEKAAGVDQ